MCCCVTPYNYPVSTYKVTKFLKIVLTGLIFPVHKSVRFSCFKIEEKSNLELFLNLDLQGAHLRKLGSS